jgi:hypothetical protein
MVLSCWELAHLGHSRALRQPVHPPVQQAIAAKAVRRRGGKHAPAATAGARRRVNETSKPRISQFFGQPPEAFLPVGWKTETFAPKSNKNVILP